VADAIDSGRRRLLQAAGSASLAVACSHGVRPGSRPGAGLDGVLPVLSPNARAAERPDVVRLRSPEVHGGGAVWQLIRAADVRATPEQLSSPGFSGYRGQPAVVPGTVLTSLVHNGVFPEPYFGLNNALEMRRIPDLAEIGKDFYTYWFRTELTLSDHFQGRRVILQLDGINYRAEIWLNGRPVGKLAGMFERGFFDVTDVIRRQGANALAILVHPVDEPGGIRRRGPKKEGAVGENRNGGDGKIGANVTMLMSVGWDFTASDGIRDRNTGIWRDVNLVPAGDVVLRHPFVRSRLSLPAADSARLTVGLEVSNLTRVRQSGKVRARIPEAGLIVEQPITLAPGETREVIFEPGVFAPLNIANPRLWWPFLKGEQNLYTLEIEMVGDDDRPIDHIRSRFGIREISSDRNTPDGSRLFRVNGHPFFVRGSNWIPEAMCRTSEARTYAELRYTRQAGINFLRFWGGGVAESDYFFELCDELGILVWVEFWQTGDTQKPADPVLYRSNVADTVRRLRGHPSLAYYVSSNERNEVVEIKSILDRLDPLCGYQIGSEVDGIHDGSPYVYVNPMSYYDDTASPRGSRINGFCPEYGVPCLPTLDALREMMPAPDLWPINKTVWDYRDGAGFHRMTTDYATAVAEYGPPRSLEDFERKAQLVGAVSYRGIWENWNRNRLGFGDRFCSGVLFWYHNSPLRQVCGRMWDWSLEPTAALYATQNALEPLHAQLDFVKNTVSVNNEHRRPFRGQVEVRVFNLDATLAHRAGADVEVPADSVANDVLQVAWPPDLSPVHFVRLDLRDPAGAPVASTFYWRSTDPYRGPRTRSGPLYGKLAALADLPRPQVAAAVERIGFRHRVRLENTGSGLAFSLRVALRDGRTRKPIRPSFYSDNFIALLPGECRALDIEPLFPPGPHETRVITLEGWNLGSSTIASHP
jgi:mannosylglycoprotein endo-beta-mannosidase